ncbi:hypothetical protein HWV62_22485 [Athelia sp. TMB]|nr:hypothetical protein HWV62_22485 [Athelia sp. TMB]
MDPSTPEIAVIAPTAHPPGPTLSQSAPPKIIRSGSLRAQSSDKGNASDGGPALTQSTSRKVAPRFGAPQVRFSGIGDASDGDDEQGSSTALDTTNKSNSDSSSESDSWDEDVQGPMQEARADELNKTSLKVNKHTDLIEKPPGQPGRPGSGGYNLENKVGLTEKDYDNLQVWQLIT